MINFIALNEKGAIQRIISNTNLYFGCAVSMGGAVEGPCSFLLAKSPGNIHVIPLSLPRVCTTGRAESLVIKNTSVLCFPLSLFMERHSQNKQWKTQEVFKCPWSRLPPSQKRQPVYTTKVPLESTIQRRDHALSVSNDLRNRVWCWGESLSLLPNFEFSSISLINFSGGYIFATLE